jgi:hypothetical protein
MGRVLRRRVAILPLIAVAACISGEKGASADSSASMDPQVTSSAATGTASVSGARIASAHACR